MDKKGAVGGQAKQRRSESRSREAGEAMSGGATGCYVTDFGFTDKTARR
jgi:hypothetical protein